MVCGNVSLTAPCFIDRTLSRSWQGLGRCKDHIKISNHIGNLMALLYKCFNVLLTESAQGAN